MATGWMNNQIIKLFCDTAHRQTGQAVGVVRVGVAGVAVEVQVPRVATRVLGTAPVAAAVTTGVQRAAGVVPVAGGRQHQVIAKKIGAAVVSRTV